ncbi:hypothetical protein PHSY_002523 [Pseudozyma hubeiensis SY62]|uniref:Uncharacterized protein n=1 Tax=Pseudozyma hubeiensis (strain SY62) TaxID=1305764 RepID=R9PA46_PSEHS|nr:hypothetical protein PHSY_002523 [Pseudozyma hubeiensis SY62]GAC94950.1 hypothetical protein PHSY_002523 [Pseudozyma hubeiensis SY62]
MSRLPRLTNILPLLLLYLTTTSAFHFTFPTSSNYWVSCGWNNMTWQSDASDPRVVTIMLTNTNKTLLNDDFEIGNALQGGENAAMVYIPCLAASSGYSLMFVNASQYDHKSKFGELLEAEGQELMLISKWLLLGRETEDKVLYTSSSFNIKPKGAKPDPASGQSDIPGEVQPYLNTPGIVLPPPAKPDEVTNTTANANNKDAPLPRLDGSSASFGTFNPVQQHNGCAAGLGMWGDFVFVVVVAAFTVLVVTA